MIESLIQFLFDNIIFLIFVIGGIMSFLKRLNDDNKERSEQQKPRPKPTIDPFGFPNSDETKRPKPTIDPFGFPGETRRSKPVMENRPNNADLETVDHENPYLEKLKEVQNKKTNDVRENPLDPIKTTTLNKKKRKSIVISKSKAREGIIWSEILGTPKSKQRYMNRYK